MAMGYLADELQSLRARLPRSEWLDCCAASCRTHHLSSLLYQDPFTHHAVSRPRGYPGDAHLLDLIYRLTPSFEQITSLGERLYQYTTDRPACRSVRERRHLLAALIDQVASECSSPRILSVGCGHLREAQLSGAVRDKAVSTFVAMDQDPQSLSVVAKEWGDCRVQAVYGTVRGLLTGSIPVEGRFDLVYAAGLYDYLKHPVATALTSALFRLLRPGGRLLIANFAPNLADIGYMEAFMDWHLIYRTESEVGCFADGVEGSAVASRRQFRDIFGNLVFLELCRC
jgi:SAM-dependent methyltransferase